MGVCLRTILAVLLSTFVTIGDPAPARAVTAGDVLLGGGIMGDRLLDRVGDTGDHWIQALAARLKMLVDYARSKYSGALNETLEKTGGELRSLLDEVQGLVADGQDILDGVKDDVRDSIRGGSVVVSQLPFARWGLVINHQPTLLRPPALRQRGEMTVTVFGNGFSSADIECTVASGSCVAKKGGDGTVDLMITGMNEPDDSRQLVRIDIGLKLKWDSWWPFSSEKPVAYTLPVFRLPDSPVEVDIFRVRSVERVVETKKRVLGVFTNRSSKLNHRQGCRTHNPKGEDWKIDVASAQIKYVSRDGGSATIDKRHSTPEALKVCYNVKPARKGFEKGHVKYEVIYTEHRYEADHEADDEPIWEGSVPWRGPVLAKIPADGGVGWRAIVSPFWGGDVPYSKTDADRLIDIETDQRDPGILYIKMRAGARIPALREAGVR